jgi:translation initiation factor IF-3
VRLITADGEQLGIKPIEEALRLAQESNLDLVEVAPMAKPPVCKIVDQGKVLFDARQRLKSQKKKQHIMVIKEIKVRLKIDKHDYETKLKRAVEFLEHGDKVKFTIMFRGREVAHLEIGRELVARIQEDLKLIGEIEGGVARMGKIHSFLVARRKDYKPKPKPVEPGKAKEPAQKKGPVESAEPTAADAVLPAGEPAVAVAENVPGSVD